MGSQRDQTADEKVQEGLMDTRKETDAAAEGCYQKLWLRKIRFVCFLLIITVVSLGLLIVIIALAVTLSDDKMTTKGPMDSPTAKATNAGEKMTEEPMDSPTAKATDSDCYSEIRKQLCVGIEQESSGCTACPGGWLGHNERCYYISSGKESWKGSRETCERMGADLLIIEDREEQEFIDRFYKGRADVFWIGAHRDGGRGEDGQHLSQLSGEPSADCPGLYSGVGFYKDTCTNRNSWICEKEALKI